MTYSPDALTSYRAAVTHVSQASLRNDAYLLRWSKSLGAYNLFLRQEGSVDSVLGNGDNENASAGWSHSGFYQEVDYDRVTPNFIPRLGFQPEVDLIGPSTVTFYNHPYAKGPFIDRNLGLITQWYRHESGGFYRDEQTTFTNFTLRNQLNLGLSLDNSNFEGDHDHTTNISAEYPHNNQRNHYNASYTTGVQAQQRYNNYSLSSSQAYRNKLSSQLSYQIVKLGDTYSNQAIVTGTYDLGRDRSVSGRFLEQTGGTNFFVSFQQSGNRGAEYYVIVGAPNATVISNQKYLINVRTSLILKVVMPFKVK